MSRPPLQPEPQPAKGGFRKFFQKLDKVFHSRSSSQDVNQSIRAYAPSPSPNPNPISPPILVPAASQKSQFLQAPVNIPALASPTSPWSATTATTTSAGSDVGLERPQFVFPTGSPTSPPPISKGYSTHATSYTDQPSSPKSHVSDLPQQPGGMPWTGLKSALGGLHHGCKLFPPLESAVGAVISCLEVVESRQKNYQEYHLVTIELTTMSEALARHMGESRSFRMSSCVANVACLIEQQAQLISCRRGRGVTKQLVNAHSDEHEILIHYRRIESLFKQLQNDATLSIWSAVDEQLANTRLEGLMPAKMAKYNSKLSTDISRRTCTDGTRTNVLTGLDTWSYDPDVAPMYWMDGMAGTGKTTIACSFSKSLEERNQLAASFFCTRTSPECRDASRIVPTVAYQLARYSIPFQAVLCEVLRQDPDIGSANISEQFRRLLRDPLLQIKEAIPDNLVVVIDALDECENRGGVELILDTLFELAADLPLRFFVTSRPEPEIYQRMVTQDDSFRKVLHLHDIEKSMVQADIELYLKEELKFMSPTALQIEQLTRRSGNLFIYAATLVRYIRLGKRLADPHKRLRSVLSMKSQSQKEHAEIDALYIAVLESALAEEELDSEETETMRLVLWTVLCSQEPVSVGTLAALAGLDDPDDVLTSLQLLRSVVHFSEKSGLISTLHASFPDFMFNKERSGAFHCDVTQHSLLLSRRCFQVMKTQLRFNMPGVQTSFFPDNEVAGLQERVKDVISPELSYTCRYWGDHLRLAAELPELHVLLDDFLTVRLLFWIEVMNLKGVMGLGPEVLLKVKLWLRDGVASPDLIRLTEDARIFTTRFAANPVSLSTPHLYVSLLAFCPRSSTVSKNYWPRTHGLLDVERSIMDRREVAAVAIWNAGVAVNAVAYSYDGTRVACGCSDGTITIRNAYDGTILLGPFKSHDQTIRSIAFSPDGTRVVSGSEDSTVRVWNTRTGALAGSPLVGHTGSVMSVAFSPDGFRIASASADRTIRTWDVQNSILLETFTGHTAPVTSLAFSPDGLHIASASADQTVGLWNSHDGTMVVDPFKGHSDEVWAVAFSPDGKRVASGSSDFSIRVWDISNGTTIAGPFKIHTGVIHSVRFSPNGTRIVSASSDRTIRISNAHDGVLVAGPYEGHSQTVWSVAFSPDGTRVVSGSEDFMIQVWNAHAGTLVPGAVDGHSDTVLSVAFSSDGTRLVSGSADRTVRVWNISDGMPIVSPFKGHSDSVNSVAFSPDGLQVASGSADQTIRVWSAESGATHVPPFEGHTGSVISVAFSPDGTRIASGSDDCSVCLWNPQDGTRVTGPMTGHSACVRSVGFIPDGTRVVSGADDHTIRIWGTQNGALVAGPFEGHTGPVRSIALSPDGTRIALGSEDHAVQVWSMDDGKPVGSPLRGHTSHVLSVTFSPDGTQIASGSSDRTVRVWNVHTGKSAARTFRDHIDQVNSVAFSPDGTCIVSGSSDRTIRVWNVSDDPTADSKSNIARLRTPYLRYTGGKTWSIRDDGWIIDDQSRWLFRVPLDICRFLPSPRVALIISPFGPWPFGPYGLTRSEHSDILSGDCWNDCYVP